MDPNLHLSIRQPLPGLNGRWEALADFSNLLAQGYVTVNGQDSRIDARSGFAVVPGWGKLPVLAVQGLLKTGMRLP